MGPEGKGADIGATLPHFFLRRIAGDGDRGEPPALRRRTPLVGYEQRRMGVERTEASEEQIEAAVARALGYEFTEPALLRDALTHRSFRNERPRLARTDNERLEFLGDALLGMRVATLLFEAFPDAREGALTRKRADLVCEGTLADIARQLGLGPALRLGRGEDRSGGRDKPRLLASALEALLGAVHVDGGIDAAFAVIDRLFEERLRGATARRDAKSRFQELVQARHHETPIYRLLRTEGPDHERQFTVALEVGGESVAEGVGRSKGDAERDAARKALAALETDL